MVSPKNLIVSRVKKNPCGLLASYLYFSSELVMFNISFGGLVFNSVKGLERGGCHSREARNTGAQRS